jgi:hypothetical protein
MHIVRTKGFIGKHPVKYGKRSVIKPVVTNAKNVLTETAESLTPETTGAGIQKLNRKIEQTKLQDPDSKLKKFISLKI